MNINDVGLYRHYYKNVKKKTDTFQWRTMVNPRYYPLPRSNGWSERLHNPFWSKRKARLKSRSNRALEQKKKKSCVEEGVNDDNSKDE